MNTHLSVLALSAIIIAGIGIAPAFGQIVNPITVTTDKTSYEDGDKVLVTGVVRELLSGTPISLIVTAPNGNRVILDQLDVGLDKTYSTQFTVGGPLMRAGGAYTIEVTYGSQTRTAETTFMFAGSSAEPSKETKMAVAGTEFMVSYKIIGGKLISITPDVEANSLIIAITASQDGSLVITLPRALIDAKMGDQDDTFFVLVDGEEVDFEETTTSTDRTLTILFPAGAEEIEIIGTTVVPEFGTIAVMILAVAIISIIAVSAKSKLSIMPRY